MVELHPRLAADTVALGSFPLSRLLLMNDRRYPWCILVPQVADARELHLLEPAAQQQLLCESSSLARAMMAAFVGDKFNLAALGNLVPQLHLHHVVRRRGDAAWPQPVWGRGAPQPYDAATLEDVVQRLRNQPLAALHWDAP